MFNFDELIEEILLCVVLLLDVCCGVFYFFEEEIFVLFLMIGGDVVGLVLRGGGEWFIFECVVDLFLGVSFVFVVLIEVEGVVCGILVVGDKES